MPATRIQLTISSPCRQPWHDMTPNEHGRFCMNCQKTVVDFTAMTDQQIAAHFLMKNHSVCGRFTTNQLNKSLVIAPDKPPGLSTQRWIGLVATGLLSWITAQGQSTTVVTDDVQVSQHKTPELPKLTGILQQESVSEGDSALIIAGQVISNEDNLPIPGVTIHLKGTSWQTRTDAKGSFALSVADFQANKAILVASFIGFVSQEIAINSANKKALIILLAEDASMLGEVVLLQKPTFWQRLRNRLRGRY